MEALFLIRLIPSAGDFKGPVVHFEDIGELRHLLDLPPEHPRLFTGFLYHHLRVQFHYRSAMKHKLFCFRTKSGARAPLCFQSGTNVLAVIPVEDGLETALFGARAFLKAHPRGKVILADREKGMDQLLTPQIRRVNVGKLL
ncbi:MAG: hypothetical protein KGP28_03735 [Bdellovibrionales bacterium]|nr:hypothetical protein [Bdellovibrionales bacterium]